MNKITPIIYILVTITICTIIMHNDRVNRDWVTVVDVHESEFGLAVVVEHNVVYKTELLPYRYWVQVQGCKDALYMKIKPGTIIKMDIPNKTVSSVHVNDIEVPRY